ncbi:hypothetical protein Y032_0130g1561 [Ancylostoma ceylanicum]|nr:hypothetical protein Y032_0130g1561 [Ancylostoma ceylanicum]
MHRRPTRLSRRAVNAGGKNFLERLEIGLEAGPVFRWPLGRCECLTQLWDNVTHSENAHFPSSESSCVFQDLFENKTNSA